jgi:hypothetical protein
MINRDQRIRGKRLFRGLISSGSINTVVKKKKEGKENLISNRTRDDRSAFNRFWWARLTCIMVSLESQHKRSDQCRPLPARTPTSITPAATRVILGRKEWFSHKYQQIRNTHGASTRVLCQIVTTCQPKTRNLHQNKLIQVCRENIISQRIGVGNDRRDQTKTDILLSDDARF